MRKKSRPAPKFNFVKLRIALIYSALGVLLIDFILGYSVFHFNTNHFFASLLVYFIVSLLIFPLLLFIVAVYKKSLFEGGFFGVDSGFVHVTKTFMLPIAGGLIALAISEKVSPTRMEVKIAITDFEPEPKAKVAEAYESDYVQPAIQNLGDFGDVISLKLEKIGRPYDNILGALQSERVDLAVVSPFTYIFYQKLQDKVFSDSLKVVGFKVPNTGGHHYYGGFVFNRAKGESLRKLFGSVKSDGFFDPAAYSLRLVLSEESLSTSGRLIPSRWLLEHRMSCLVKEANYLPVKEILPLIATEHRYFGALSSNQWEILQKSNPELASQLEYYPLTEIPIPFDPLMVKTTFWDQKFDRWYYLVVDFFLLRNLNLSKTRQNIILDALRGIVRPANNAEWTSCNREFIRYLFTGIVKDENTIIIPEPYSQMGYSVVCQDVVDLPVLNFHQVKLLPEADLTNRKDDWFSCEYPYQLSNTTDSLYCALISKLPKAEIPGFQEVDFAKTISSYLNAGDIIELPDRLTVRYNLETHLPGRLFTPFPDTKWK